MVNAKKNKLFIQFISALLQTSALLPTPTVFSAIEIGPVLIDCFPEKNK